MPTSSGSKRKSNNNNDIFKTRKAKVGKKVARAIKDTDVSNFKAASLYVSGQSGVVDEGSHNNLLTSSRGKSLQELLNILQTHPAVKARCSAGKGILDILGKKNVNVAPYISVILPALLQASSSSSESSDELRTVAVEGIGLLLQQQQQQQQITPFTPLMHARIASALNSLDRKVRLTGVRMAKICCEVLLLGQSCVVSLLLPPYINLLTEHSSNAENCTKVLQSLTALLKVCGADKNDNKNNGKSVNAAQSTQQWKSVDLKYVEGGRSRNAVFLSPRPKKRQRTVQQPLFLSLTDLPVVREIVVDVEEDYNVVEPTTIQTQSRRSSIKKKKSMDTDTALLSKLFDCLMECTGVENENDKNTATTEVDPTNTTVAKGGNKKKSISTDDIANDDNTRIVLVLSAVRWMHAYHDDDAANIDFHAMQHKVLTFLMEQLFGNNTSSTIDLAICSTVLHVLKEGDDSANNNRWKNAIRTSLHKQIIGPSFLSEELLNVVCLLVESDDDYYERACETLELLRHNMDDLKSSTTRRIMLLAMKSMWEKFQTVPLQYVELSTHCLQAWDVEYLYESESVLKVLSGYVQRVDFADLHNVRDGMAALFEASPSIFERYPESLQRMVLGIVVMTQHPSDDILKALATICSRKEQQLAPLITESVHSIRKTISMGAYTTFLINTVAMPKRVKALKAANGDGAVMKTMLSVDAPLTHMAKLLLSSGPPAARILEMIQPQLAAWQTSAAAAKDKRPLEYLIKIRACFVLQAFFLLAMKQQAYKDSIVDSLPSSVNIQALQDSICPYLHCMIDDDTPAVAMANASDMISPIVAIMVAIPTLLEPIVQRVSEWFQLVHHLSRKSQIHMLEIMVQWIKDERLRPILKDKDTTKAIGAHTVAIGECESVTDNETALQLVRDVTGQLELLKVI